MQCCPGEPSLKSATRRHTHIHTLIHTYASCPPCVIGQVLRVGGGGAEGDEACAQPPESQGGSPADREKDALEFMARCVERV